MRLTLRTLLAYRDKVLNPVDYEDLHRRIHQNETALSLLKRIERVAGELQGGSVIVGKGMAADPNTIAAYLDDSMPKEQVAEFERVCLASDHYLGELAQCHRLLATAMRSRVVVPERLRELGKAIGDPTKRDEVRRQWLEHKKEWRHSVETGSLYRLDAAHHAQSISESGATTGQPGEEVPPSGNSAAPASSQGSEQPVSAEGADAGEILTAELAGPAAKEQGVQRSADGTEPATKSEEVQVSAPMIATAGESIREEGLDLESEVLFREVPDYLRGGNGKEWKLPVLVGVLVVLLVLLAWQAIGPWEKIRSLFVASEPVPVAADGRQSVDRDAEGKITTDDAGGPEQRPGGTQDVEPATPDEQKEASGRDSEVAPGQSDAAAGKEASAGKVAAPKPAADNATDATSDEKRAEGPSSTDMQEVASETPSQPADAAGSTGPAERWVLRWSPEPVEASDAVVLLQDATGALSLAVPKEAMPDDSTMVIPPNQVATLQHGRGTQWRVMGTTRLALPAAADQPVGALLCRALIESQRAGAWLELVTVSGTLRIEWPEAGSIASVDLSHRRRGVGSILDPAAFPPVLVVVAAKGKIRMAWRPDNADRPAIVDLELGEAVGVVDGQAPTKFSLGSIPGWFRGGNARPIDQLGVHNLAQLLRDETMKEIAVEQRLRDLTQHQRPETAAAAIQASVLVGDFEPLMGVMLNQPRFHAHWYPTLDLTRQVLAAEPALLKAVVTALQDHFGDRADAYRTMLLEEVGESPSNAVAAWINMLNDEHLAGRILASYALRRLVNVNLGYLPHAPNRSVIAEWRRMLTTNRLQLPKDVDPLWERRR